MWRVGSTISQGIIITFAGCVCGAFVSLLHSPPPVFAAKEVVTRFEPTRTERDHQRRGKKDEVEDSGAEEEIEKIRMEEILETRKCRKSTKSKNFIRHLYYRK